MKKKVQLKYKLTEVEDRDVHYHLYFSSYLDHVITEQHGNTSFKA
jgi:hypothetical protein